MQRIERYGVIALVFLLVTIVAVSLWGEQKKAGGLFSFLKRDGRSAQVDRLVADARDEAALPSVPAPARDPGGRMLSLADGPDLGPAPRARSAPPPAWTTPVTLGLSPQAEPTDGRPDVMGSLLPPELPAERGLAAARDGTPPEARPAPSADPARYTIRSGDTLSEIALRELGSSKRWREIVALNPGLDPARLAVGRAIALPGAAGAAVAQAPRSAPTPTPVREQANARPRVEGPRAAGRYTIRAGDTLGEIALRELGSSRRWREIVALNPGLDPARLAVGRAIELPSSSTAGAATRSSVASLEPSPRRTASEPAGWLRGTRQGSKVR